MTAVQLSLLVAEPVAGWNPYWTAFAAAHGSAPGAVREAMPGVSCNARFLCWMTQQWNEWADLCGITEDRVRRERADEFSAWLAAEHPAVES